jgi:hypothetical protein
MADDRRTLTWKDIKDWAWDNKITDDTPVHIATVRSSPRPVLDLNESRDDRNEPVFVLQAWWG